MTGFVMFLHAIISLVLIVIILMQSGRGGGLTEGFASAESMFGAKTNEFMIKGTTVFAGLFLVTCLSLAVLSAQKGKSLMSGSALTQPQELPPVEINEPAAQTQEAVAEPPQEIPLETPQDVAVETPQQPAQEVVAETPETVAPPANEVPAPPAPVEAVPETQKP